MNVKKQSRSDDDGELTIEDVIQLGGDQVALQAVTLHGRG